MHGQFVIGPSPEIPFVFEYVIDRGIVELKGIPGTTFDGVRAKDVVYANLIFNNDFGTLVAPVTFRWTYSKILSSKKEGRLKKTFLSILHRILTLSRL
jgi:hypothetical protein